MNNINARERLRGIAYMVAAVFVFAIMDALLKGMSRRYGPLHVVLAVLAAADRLGWFMGDIAAEKRAAASVSSGARHRHAGELHIRHPPIEPRADLFRLSDRAAHDDGSIGPDSRRDGNRQAVAGGGRRPLRRAGYSEALGAPRIFDDCGFRRRFGDDLLFIEAVDGPYSRVLQFGGVH